MIWFIIIVGALVVVVIALLAIGNVTQRLVVEPKRHVFEGDEALSFVVEALPDRMTAVLSHDDVERVIRLHLDYLHRAGLARSAGDPGPSSGPVVVNRADGISYIVEYAGYHEFVVSREQAGEVIDAHWAYFEAIGAIGDEVTVGQLGDTEIDPLVAEALGGEERPAAAPSADPDPPTAGQEPSRQDSDPDG